MSDRTELRVFISSPGDCESERSTVEDVLTELNKTTARANGVFFSSVRWEDFAPGIGETPQDVIDQQLGEYDILLGLMWLRYGTPLKTTGVSGTEHEVDNAIDACRRRGAPRVMFYFNQALPASLGDVDPGQFQRVKDFQRRLGDAGLYQTFNGTADLASKLRLHLHRVLELRDHHASPRVPVAATPPKSSRLPSVPYSDFSTSFRDIVAPHRVSTTGGLLHLVFGSLADIRELPVVLPMSQTFDFMQRGPRSVLAAFAPLHIDGRPFFDSLEYLFPQTTRPKAAGLGHTHYLSLPSNTQCLPGVMLVSTTRDLSTSNAHYGYYVNTPVEGVDYVLQRVVDQAASENLAALALPLLGAGYANAGRAFADPALRHLIERTVLLLTIKRLLLSLEDAQCTLRRAVVVVYSSQRQSPAEHALWAAATGFLGMPETRREDAILDSLKEIKAHSKTEH